MTVVYLSSCCSDAKFEELRKKRITQKLPQAQKYHRLMMEGMASQLDVNLFSISALPINSEWTKKIVFHKEEETVNGVSYIYNTFLNLPILRQATRKIAAFREIKKIYKNNKDLVIVCDILNQSIAMAGRKAGKKYKLPVIGIVTDVPGYTSGARRNSISFYKRKIKEYAEKCAKNTLGKYDAYLFLTQEMNNVINKSDKPYIVLEGHCDSKMQSVDNSIKNKAHPKVIMYAGGIHKEFGIKRMVEAFCETKQNDWELHIYGDGNYQHELKELAIINPKVRYFGVQPNDLIVRKQLEATLLINPRLTDADYVKYSFPSKTMECMASGTPLLTTKLPGMPMEYYKYVYFINDESREGMKKTLESVFDKSEMEMHEFGNNAKRFILNNKTNIIQSKKFIEFIKEIENGKKS